MHMSRLVCDMCMCWVAWACKCACICAFACASIHPHTEVFSKCKQIDKIETYKATGEIVEPKKSKPAASVYWSKGSKISKGNVGKINEISADEAK